MDESKLSFGNKKTRGRPRGEPVQQVAERLLEVTEKLLQTRSHFDLTEQKIAQEAGTDKSMIHYYFGNKDGLLFELVRRQTDDWSERLKALESIDPGVEQDITRVIFKVLIDVYYSKPWITRIMVSEFSRNSSVIRKSYFERCGPKGLGSVRLRRLIEKLIKMGVYSSGVDAESTAVTMLFTVTAPLLLAQISGDFGFSLDEYKKDDWITHLVDLFNCRLNTHG